MKHSTFLRSNVSDKIIKPLYVSISYVNNFNVYSFPYSRSQKIRRSTKIKAFGIRPFWICSHLILILHLKKRHRSTHSRTLCQMVDNETFICRYSELWNDWILHDNNRDIKFISNKGTCFNNKYQNDSNRKKIERN